MSDPLSTSRKVRARVDARGWWRIGPVRIEPKAGENPADRERLAKSIEQFLNDATRSESTATSLHPGSVLTAIGADRYAQSADVERVMLPRELTAENGMKAALMGEFAFEPYIGRDGLAIVPWDTIKQIYRRIVELAGSTPSAIGVRLDLREAVATHEEGDTYIRIASDRQEP